MNILLFLVPITLFLSLIGLATFLWNLRSKQYDDLEGAANRILFDEDRPRNTSKTKQNSDKKNDKKSD